MVLHFYYYPIRIWSFCTSIFGQSTHHNKNLLITSQHTKEKNSTKMMWISSQKIVPMQVRATSRYQQHFGHSVKLEKEKHFYKYLIRNNETYLVEFLEGKCIGQVSPSHPILPLCNQHWMIMPTKDNNSLSMKMCNFLIYVNTIE